MPLTAPWDLNGVSPVRKWPDRPADFGAVLRGQAGIRFPHDIQFPHRKIGGSAVGRDPLAEGAVAVLEPLVAARMNQYGYVGCWQTADLDAGGSKRCGQKHGVLDRQEGQHILGVVVTRRRVTAAERSGYDGAAPGGRVEQHSARTRQEGFELVFPDDAAVGQNGSPLLMPTMHRRVPVG